MAYRFGQFVLDPRTGTLTGPEGNVPLRRQTFRLLEVLLEHAPQLLDRDTLLDQAWGRTALSPNVIPQAISELRQALGDRATEPRYIETLHRRGYRVACPVEVLGEVLDAPDAQAVPGETTSRDTHRPAVTDGPPGSARTRLQHILLAGCLIALAVISGLWWNQQREQRWLLEEAIPEIRERMEVDLVSAWRHAREVRQRVRDDPMLEQLWLDLSLPATLESDPPGAEIRVRGYREPDADWILLGRTPLPEQELPLAMLRFRVELAGHAPIEAAPSVLPAAETFRLHPLDQAPEDMVYVPPGPVTYLLEQRQLPGFWIDRHEVTNRQFREFVADGGYNRREFWRTLPPDADPDTFVDATGMPGPSTWSLGSYPEGTGDHPVEGVSYHEAAAYAAWAGRQLPTVFHWYRAAGFGTRQIQNFSDVLLAGNFSGRGTAPVGSRDSLGHYGAHDMAGNVAEWCVNGDGELRHILGGSWLDHNYRFRDPEAHSPWERRAGFGLRLMQQDQPVTPELVADVRFPDRRLAEPVDDNAFDIYRRQFDYDPVPLEARIDEIDDSHPDWRREWVSFAAGYSQDRVTAQLLIPRNAEPPYQTLVHYPGGDALLLDSSRKAGLHHLEAFLRSGRAVVYPVYPGTFERKTEGIAGPVTWRDLLVHQVKDLRRTLDYLETRPEFDSDRMVLHGVSYGGFRTPYALAVENRFQAAIILSAGVIPMEHIPPEVRVQDYLPRVEIPVLLINGRDDYNFPLETSQMPFFELLGTPPENKRHLVLDWGHLPAHYADVVGAGRQWLDRWLGTVEPAGS